VLPAEIGVLSVEQAGDMLATRLMDCWQEASTGVIAV
jgi:hypothetical protein